MEIEFTARRHSIVILRQSKLKWRNVEYSSCNADEYTLLYCSPLTSFGVTLPCAGVHFFSYFDKRGAVTIFLTREQLRENIVSVQL